MEKTISQDMVQGTFFEENYLSRTHKTLTSNPVVAITELVANAWDAGASKVIITIPDTANKLLFKLKSMLCDRYHDVSGIDLTNDSQLPLFE